jgi:hypothetical protein
MWPSDAAKWTWVVPLLWFLFGLLVGAGRGIWGAHESVRQQPSSKQMIDFFAFTIPAIRAAAYSLGAFVASRVYRTVAPAQRIIRLKDCWRNIRIAQVTVVGSTAGFGWGSQNR